MLQPKCPDVLTWLVNSAHLICHVFVIDSPLVTSSLPAPLHHVCPVLVEMAFFGSLKLYLPSTSSSSVDGQPMRSKSPTTKMEEGVVREPTESSPQPIGAHLTQTENRGMWDTALLSNKSTTNMATDSLAQPLNAFTPTMAYSIHGTLVGVLALALGILDSRIYLLDGKKEAGGDACRGGRWDGGWCGRWTGGDGFRLRFL